MSKVLKIMPLDKNSKFEHGIYISDARQLKIGKHVRINENVFLQGSINVGNYVMIAPNVSIYSKTHIHNDINIPMVLSGETETKAVIIEDDVWIGINCTILPGIKIGKGAIIGAHSVVTKDVASYTIVGGVPAKLIRSRLDESYKNF
jgi:maltose O-acetyltransferase